MPEIGTSGSMSGDGKRGVAEWPKLPRPSSTLPYVWTGRALQAESDDLEKLVLRICIRPIHGAFELLAIMDIRACSISFASRPRRPYGPRPFSISSFRLADLGGKANSTIGLDTRFITALLSQHRPGDPCQLVGESGGQNVGMEALSGTREPDPEAVFRPACRP